MSKELYLKELERCLRHLPAEDRQAAIDYYRDYIDDAIANGDGDESEVIAKLCSAEELSAGIITDVAISSLSSEESSSIQDDTGRTDKKVKSKHNAATTIWIVILAIFASPVALPVAITLLVLMMVPIIVVASVLFAFFVCMISIIPSSLVLLLSGISILSSQTGNAIVLIGNGLTSLGLSGFIMLFIVWLARAVARAFKAIGRWIVGIVSKKREKV